MTLAAVSVDAQTVQRDWKIPRGNAKAGDKRANEKTRKLADKKHIPMAQASLFCALLRFPWEEAEG